MGGKSIRERKEDVMGNREEPGKGILALKMEEETMSHGMQMPLEAGKCPEPPEGTQTCQHLGF